MITVGTNNVEGREKWIRETLKKIPAGSKLLDAGAGQCIFKQYCSHLEYIAQDFGQYDGKGDVGIQTGEWDNSQLDIVSDITEIPLPDGSVDAVMCTEVFEHIPHPVKALNEFSRLVRSGGYLLITAPFCSLTHFAPYHFYTGFSKFFYETHLRDNGFEIIEQAFNGNYFEYIGQEVRRVWQVADKYTNKKLSLIDKIFLKGSLRALDKLSKVDSGSSELLCYGVHIFARKK
jgi:ubiquinone/menaquinone biosynthesis C-methylase UbiE